jgi:phosphatidylglycerol:prolipoprotein diacylglycerol transferase
MMLIGAALLISFGVLLWETRRSWSLAQAANSALITLALGLLGARIEHVILNWKYFATVPPEILNFAAGGLSAHGAIIGAVAGGWIAVRVARNSFDPWLSTASYVICIISIAAWWGCAAVSCAYGAEVGNLSDYPTWLVWEAPGDFLMVVPRYAVQPLGAVTSTVLLCLISLSAALGVTGRHRVGLALAGALIINFMLGFLRGDPGPLMGNLRLTQVFDLMFIVAGVLIAAWPRRHSVSAA